MKVIRTACIGMGYRGCYLISLMREIQRFCIVALADIDPHLQQKISRIFPITSQPVLYNDYKRMLDSEQIDLILIASPWHLHKEHALASLQAGCNVALEVKGALSFDEYRIISQVSKLAKKTVYPLENTLFMRSILAVNNMVHSGLFGELIFLQGGYRHDLRNIMIDCMGNFGSGTGTESEWRSPYYETENGDLYPTHGLAPLCLFLDINKKDRIKTITSFATRGTGIYKSIAAKGGEDHPDLNRNFRMGDIITTILQTASGAQINLLHDTTLPRPRSLNYEVQGTKGIWNAEKGMIYVEGISPWEEWEPEEQYIKAYEHIYWIQWGEKALSLDYHHQGMDYIMLKALESALSDKTIFPATLEDMATWALITPYSKESIRHRKTLHF